MDSLTFHGRNIQVRVERKRVRHIYLRIGHDYQLRVVLPYDSRIKVEELLEKKRSWIEKKVHEISQQQRVVTKDRILYEGRALVIKMFSVKNPGIRIYRDVVRVYGSSRVDRGQILSEFLREQTTRRISDVAPGLAQVVGVEYGKLTVKDMKKWGYCRKNGDLGFNSKLICLPKELVEYVVVHELVHLRHFSHSDEFKKEVSKYCGNYREFESWLKKYIIS